MTPLGIEPATFRLVAHCLNHMGQKIVSKFFQIYCLDIDASVAQYNVRIKDVCLVFLNYNLDIHATCPHSNLNHAGIIHCSNGCVNRVEHCVTAWWYT